VLIKQRDSIFSDLNIPDIKAVPADDFDAAIGQIATCKQGRVHAAPSWAKMPHLDAQLTEPCWAGEMRMQMSS
jgi:hypothetical protein